MKMIVQQRRDINAALLDLSIQQTDNATFEPEAAPDEALLEVMEKHGVASSDLPLVRQALLETIALLALTDYDSKEAIEIVKALDDDCFER